MATITKGTQVRYRGCFGTAQPEVVKVVRIERSIETHSKYGKKVASVPFEEREYCIFDLDNGHWCYGDQIDEIV